MKIKIHLPSFSVVRCLICIPMRTYSTNMSIIGITKNKHVDISHKGIPGGLSNMAQNAESYIVELSVIRMVSYKFLLKGFIVIFLLSRQFPYSSQILQYFCSINAISGILFQHDKNLHKVRLVGFRILLDEIGSILNQRAEHNGLRRLALQLKRNFHILCARVLFSLHFRRTVNTNSGKKQC